MAIPLHLAMTAAETLSHPLPENMAYMACHFASYGLGISNIPTRLPAGSMLILNDRIPVWQHDPAVVARQLADTVAAFSCSTVLLDFQRKDDPKAASVVRAVLDILPCPVGVSEDYADDLDCPVFVSSPAPDVSLEKHTMQWRGRELWLEAAPETIRITINSTGADTVFLPTQFPEEPCHWNAPCCCRYHTEVFDDHVVFTLSRTRTDLPALLELGETFGVTRAVGLYQQLGK